MNIERAIATAGFMGEGELACLGSLAIKCLRIVEIGSWRGRSTRAFADNTLGIVTCVDTWADNAYGASFPGDAPDLCQHPDWLWNEFNKNLADHIAGNRIRTMRMTSVAAAQVCAMENKTFDLAFIDASHTYEDVKQDILCWRPLLAPGGILCGHDYQPLHHPGVVQAVDELLPGCTVEGTIWVAPVVVI